MLAGCLLVGHIRLRVRRRRGSRRPSGASRPYQYRFGETLVCCSRAHPAAALSSALGRCCATSGRTSRRRPRRQRRRKAHIAALSRSRRAGTYPVQIRQPDPAPLQLLQTIVGPLIEPLATTGIVIVFVVFMLLQREDLRDRLFLPLAPAICTGQPRPWATPPSGSAGIP